MPRKRRWPRWLRRAATVDHLDLLAWNVHVGNGPAGVTRTLIAEHDRLRFDVAVLNEVRHLQPELAKWARQHDYRHFQETPPRGVKGKPEEGSTAVLITEERGDLEKVKYRVLAMGRWWKVFSRNTTRRPRRYGRLRFRTCGGPWKLTGSHWPTLGFAGGNRAAFAESAARAAAALKIKRPGVIGVDVGDHNESVTRLRSWGRALGAQVVGKGPDSCIVTGPAFVEAEVRPKHGSDHHLMRYRITRTTRRFSLRRLGRANRRKA